MAKVKCRAFPTGSDAVNDKLIEKWCKENMCREMCVQCPLFPANGPEVSIYQKNKSKGKEKQNVE